MPLEAPSSLTNLPIDPYRHLHKMHAAGNDFIILPLEAPSPSPSLCRFLTCRRNSLGADGILAIRLLEPRESQSARRLSCRAIISFFNADGSQVGMCGNALRAATLHLYLLSLSGSVPRELLSSPALEKIKKSRASQNPQEHFEVTLAFEEEDEKPRWHRCRLATPLSLVAPSSDQKETADRSAKEIGPCQITSYFPLATPLTLQEPRALIQAIERELMEHKRARKRPSSLTSEQSTFKISFWLAGVEHLLIEAPPHEEELLQDPALPDLAKTIRSLPELKAQLPQGTNISFLQKKQNEEDPTKRFYALRTFERGVTEETWSCASATVAAVSSFCSENSSLAPAKESKSSLKAQELKPCTFSLTFPPQQQLLQLKLLQEPGQIELQGPAQSCYLVDGTQILDLDKNDLI